MLLITNCRRRAKVGVLKTDDAFYNLKEVLIHKRLLMAVLRRSTCRGSMDERPVPGGRNEGCHDQDGRMSAQAKAAIRQDANVGSRRISAARPHTYRLSHHGPSTYLCSPFGTKLR